MENFRIWINDIIPNFNNFKEEIKNVSEENKFLAEALDLQTEKWWEVGKAAKEVNQCFAENIEKATEQSGAVEQLGFDIDKYSESLKEAEQAAEKAFKDQVEGVKDLRKEIEDLNEKILESTQKYNEDATSSQDAYYTSVAKMVAEAEKEIIELRKERDEAILAQDEKEVKKLNEKITKQQAIIDTYQKWNLGIEDELAEQKRYLAMNELEQLQYDYQKKAALREIEFLQEQIQLQTQLKAKKDALDMATKWIGIEKMTAINAEIEKTKTFKEKLAEKTNALLEWIKDQKTKYQEYVNSINSILSQLKMPTFSGGLYGSYATGTSYVPETGPYLLHKGEAVIPSGKNSAGITVNILGGTYLSEDVAEEIGNKIIDKLKFQYRI